MTATSTGTLSRSQRLRLPHPANGSVTLSANGSFTYTPAANFNGSDSFVYEIKDPDGASSQATVRLTVTPVNDAPVAGNVSFTTGAGQPVTTTAGIDDLLQSATDEEGDPLTASLVDLPDHGNVTLNANGSFTYTPDSGFSGTDTFTYRVNDGQDDSNDGTVTIAVDSVNTFTISESIANGSLVGTVRGARGSEW